MSNSREGASGEVLSKGIETGRPAAAPDHEPLVTGRELLSYYLYYSGDNSVGPMVYTMVLFQSLLFSAGFEPSHPDRRCESGTSAGCAIPWGGGTMSVSGVILIANGLSFGIMTLLFTTLGSVADYGTNGRWMLLGCTVVCWASQFSLLSVKSESDWPTAMGLYISGFVSFGCTLVLYLAMFPRLARNTQQSRTARGLYEAGETSLEGCEEVVSLEHNRISNISTGFSNIGYLIMLCLSLALLLPLRDDRVNIYVIVLLTSYSILTGIWWFIFQQSRPGPSLPKGENYFTIGWKQIWMSCKQFRKLPHTFIYLAALFLLAGGFNTTTTLVLICQNDQFSFGFLKITYLYLAQAITSIASLFGFWFVQKHFKISTKKMFAVTNVWSVLIPLWGMIGIWSPNFGFHKPWEFWVYNVIFGLFQAPYYSFAQTMMAELLPPGFDAMFFGLLGVCNSASSMIFPIILIALIDRTGSNWMGFSFLFSVCLSATLVIWFLVDVPKGRRGAAAWAEDTRRKYATGSSTNSTINLSDQ